MARRDRGMSLQERIVAFIHEQRLAPGAALPTEPRLMDLLGASRNSVREAIRALQALGIVEIRHGYGTFVGNAPLDALTPSLAFRIRSRINHNVGALQDLVQVRELLEVGLIGDVAGKLSPARLAALDALVDRMADDPEADKSFHTLLYESSGNDLVLQLIGLFWDVYRAVEPSIDPPKVAPEAIARSHRQIVEVLRDGDADAARDAMRRHFAELEARVAHPPG